jgi:phosphoribosylformylglycinamidine (FGAM) synthase PurS component
MLFVSVANEWREKVMDPNGLATKGKLQQISYTPATTTQRKEICYPYIANPCILLYLRTWPWCHTTKSTASIVPTCSTAEKGIQCD